MFSKRYRKENPLCVHCLSRGITSPSQCVDHINGHSGQDDPAFWSEDNLQPLCFSCHAKKTNAEKRKARDPVDGKWVVTGDPGSGKSTWLEEHRTDDSLVWDMDEVASEHGFAPRWPRPDDEVRKLLELRRDFIRKARVATDVIMIITDRLSAYSIAADIGARVYDCGAAKVTR